MVCMYGHSVQEEMESLLLSQFGRTQCHITNQIKSKRDHNKILAPSQQPKKLTHCTSTVETRIESIPKSSVGQVRSF